MTSDTNINQKTSSVNNFYNNKTFYLKHKEKSNQCYSNINKNEIDNETPNTQFTYISNNKRFLNLFFNILKKYNLPLIIPEKQKLYNFKNDTSFFIRWDVNEFYMRELIIPQFYKNIMSRFLENPSQRFIAFPIILYNPRSIIHPEFTTHAIYNFSHIIILIYDKKYKYLERFDSGNNLYEYDSHILDTNIVNTFKNMFNLEIKGINTPWMICKSGGIQMYQEREIYNSCTLPTLGVNIGFCSIYVLWYIEKRLENQNKKPSDIIFEFYNDLYKNNISKFPLTDTIIEYTKKLIYTYDTNINYNTSLYDLFIQFY